MNRESTPQTRIGRRQLLGTIGVGAAAALAGCSMTVTENGVSVKADGDENTPESGGDGGGTETPGPTDGESDDPEARPLRDGSGTLGPGATVDGYRDGIHVAVAPAGGGDGGDADGGSGDSGTVDPSDVTIDPSNVTIDPSRIKFEPTQIDLSKLQSPKIEANEPEDVPDGCTVTRRSITAGGVENLLLGPFSNVVYPGALIDVSSIPTGEYRPVVAPRAPLRISTSLDADQFGGSAGRTVESPSLSGVRDAVNDMLREVIPGTTTGAEMRYSIEQVHDERHTKVSLGSHFESVAADVAGKFDFSSSTTSNKVLVKFLQKYYTVDVDLPAVFFADGRDPERTDAVVSSVTYGRMLVFTAESEEQVSDMRAALDATFSNLATSGGASVETEHEAVLKRMRKTVTVIGGGSAQAGQLISDGFEGIKPWIVDGANFGPDSPARPLSYQLRYLSDFGTAGVHLTTRYNERTCVREETGTYRVHNIKLACKAAEDGDGDEDVYGKIQINADDGRGNVIRARGTSDGVIWEKSGDHHLELKEHDAPTSIDTDATVEFPDFESVDESEAYISVGGHLYESDTFSDDDLGWEAFQWYLDREPSDPNLVGPNTDGQFGVTFREGGTEIRLSFDISPVY